MKKLLVLLFSLFFLSSPSVFADDISDLSIEGISIGDSLLDYMTEDEILEGLEFTKDWYSFLKEPNKYGEVEIKKNFSKYDYVTAYVINNLADMYIADTNELYTIPGIRESIQYVGNTNLNEYVSNKNEKYKILAIRASIYFPQDFDNCIKERDKIVEIFSKILSSAEKSEYYASHSADPSGDSIIDTVYLDKSYEGSRYSCIDWGESISSKNNWVDNLSISLRTEEITSWFSDY